MGGAYLTIESVHQKQCWLLFAPARLNKTQAGQPPQKAYTLRLTAQVSKVLVLACGEIIW